MSFCLSFGEEQRISAIIFCLYSTSQINPRTRACCFRFKNVLLLTVEYTVFYFGWYAWCSSYFVCSLLCTSLKRQVVMLSMIVNSLGDMSYAEFAEASWSLAMANWEFVKTSFAEKNVSIKPTEYILWITQTWSLLNSFISGGMQQLQLVYLAVSILLSASLAQGASTKVTTNDTFLSSFVYYNGLPFFWCLPVFILSMFYLLTIFYVFLPKHIY